MKFSGIEYSVNSRTLDVFLSGCDGSPKCEGCHNPELWDFSVGDDVSLANIKIQTLVIADSGLAKPMIDGFRVFGGEPLDQRLPDLLEFLDFLNSFAGKSIWLFTRYELPAIPKEVVDRCDFIKTGRYVPELKCDNNRQFGVDLATSNQKIHLIKRRTTR